MGLLLPQHLNLPYGRSNFPTHYAPPFSVVSPPWDIPASPFCAPLVSSGSRFTDELQQAPSLARSPCPWRLSLLQYPPTMSRFNAQ